MGILFVCLWWYSKADAQSTIKKNSFIKLIQNIRPKTNQIQIWLNQLTWLKCYLSCLTNLLIVFMYDYQLYNIDHKSLQKYTNKLKNITSNLNCQNVKSKNIDHDELNFTPKRLHFNSSCNKRFNGKMITILRHFIWFLFLLF